MTAGEFATGPEPHETVAAVLRRLGQGAVDERVSVGDLMALLDSRAYGFVCLLLAVPNLTPGPSVPGFSTIFGLSLCFVALEMLLGQHQPRVPPPLARLSVRRRRLVGLFARVVPIIERVERVLKPRWPALTSIGLRPFIAAALLLQGVLLALPLPVVTIAPAFATLLMALGMLARDGAAISLGLLAGIGSVAAFGTLALAALRALGYI